MHIIDLDRSAFSLMNAVTAVARDQRDPAVRWRLEELGGGVPAMNFPHVRADGFGADGTDFEIEEERFFAGAVGGCGKF